MEDLRNKIKKQFDDYLENYKNYNQNVYLLFNENDDLIITPELEDIIDDYSTKIIKIKLNSNDLDSSIDETIEKLEEIEK